MKGRYGVVAAGIAVSLLLGACGGGEAEQTEPQTRETPELTGEPIVIGMDEDSTGPGASYSVIAGNTIRDAVDKVNEEGGILGRPVELIVENDESDPTKAPTVVRKLIDDGADVIMLVTASAAVNQAKPIIQQAEVPAVAPIAISDTFATPPDNDFAFSLANELGEFADVYCGAAEALGFRTLAMLSDATPTIEGVNQLLLPGLESCLEIVAEETAPVDSADLNAQVARIRNADPDMILVSSVGGSFEVLAHNTLSQQIPDVQRFSLASIGNQPDSWNLASPGALDGMVFMGSIDENNPATQELQEFLRARRGEPEYEANAYDAQAYDGVMVIKQAIEEAGTTDGPAVRDALQEISGFPASFGQSGFTVSFAEDKHLGADGLCGLVLTVFGPDNVPAGPWDAYQPEC